MPVKASHQARIEITPKQARTLYAVLIKTSQHQGATVIEETNLASTIAVTSSRGTSLIDINGTLHHLGAGAIAKLQPGESNVVIDEATQIEKETLRKANIVELQERGPRSIRCPECGAQIGQGCISMSGKRIKGTHKARTRAYQGGEAS